MRKSSKWILAAGAAASLFAGVGVAQQAIRVGWTNRPRIEILDDAPACGIPQSRQDLQYRMDAIPGHRADDQALAAGALDCDPGAIVLSNGVVGGNLKAYIVASTCTKSPAASRSIGP